jgi:hypothetical protein
MFKKNDTHLQPPLLGTVQALPEKQRKRLETSWAAVFYREFFNRLDESIFSDLFSDIASRPNVPVNMLVSLDFLKAGHGWSDEEMYNQFQYNVQVRYALGLHELGTGHFELRTIYNFRRRLSEYQKATGEDLLAKVFVDITDAQLAAYGIYTEKQRMDSSQISSAIADASRLQLVVTGVKRLARHLDDAQQATHAELLAAYQEGQAEKFVYRVRGKAATVEALQAAGEVLARLLPVVDGQAEGKAAATYQAVERLYRENFDLTEEQTVRVRGNKEITSDALQSLDDLEASYRFKGRTGYKGYVMNVAETNDSRNEFQLITNVQVAPNNTQDTSLLCEALPSLTERTSLTDLYSDGGYGSATSDVVLHDQGVALHQTHLKGKTPDPDRYCYGDFDITFSEDGNPATISCPHGQTVPILPARIRLFARFDANQCRSCPAFETQCRVKLMKEGDFCHLPFMLKDLYWAQRRQRHRRLRKTPGDPRAAIEATIRSIKHPSGGRLPVRGLRRVTDMIVGAAAVVNIWTILRYQRRKRRFQSPEQLENQKERGQTDIQQEKENNHPSFLSIIVLRVSTKQRPFATNCCR